MAFMHTFCFWFSVRLGTIIVGIISLVQCAIWLLISILCLDNIDEVKNALNTLIKNLSIGSKFFQDLASDPQIYLIILTIFFFLMLISCIILILGAFQCDHCLLMPFVVIDFIYILFILTLHVFLMLNLKEQDSGLGQLILYSNVGGFIILYLLYLWTVVISFIQIIRELQSQMCKRKEIEGDRNIRRRILISLRGSSEEE